LCIIMPTPLIGGTLSDAFIRRLASDVCLTSVTYIVNIHGAHIYRKQGALGAAGQECMDWSWTAACGAFRGRGTSWRPPAYSSLYMEPRRGLLALRFWSASSCGVLTSSVIRLLHRRCGWGPPQPEFSLQLVLGGLRC